MFYVDIPTRDEFLTLADIRADACVTIYLETSLNKEGIEASQIQLGNLIKQALQQLKEIEFDKRRLRLLEDQLYALLEDGEFWHYQAHSLAVLATPDSIRTYRLVNRLTESVRVAERFYLKPLLRAIAFPHSAYVLALSENQVRILELFSDLTPEEIKVDQMPVNARSIVGSLAGHYVGRRLGGEEGQKVRLAQYARKVDQALRTLLLTHAYPLILVATEPLASIYRAQNSSTNLIGETIYTSPDRLDVTELATLARPLLDRYYAAQLEEQRAVFAARVNERRTTQDLSDAARAATRGAIAVLMIDIDSNISGTIDDDGAIHHTEENALSYSLVDEIAKRALATGAEVLAVRREDLPDQNSELAAILRYPL